MLALLFLLNVIQSLEGKTVLDRNHNNWLYLWADEFGCQLVFSFKIIRTAKGLIFYFEKAFNIFVQLPPTSHLMLNPLITQHVQMNIAQKQQFYSEIRKTI